MASLPPCLHSSMQRYLPGHLPKRQRQLCTGKTNLKAYEAQHAAFVQNEVLKHLTLPGRLNHLLVASPTVTRAMELNNKERDTAGTERTKRGLRSNNAVDGKELDKRNKHNTNLAMDDSVTLNSILNSNKSGKEHGFTGEKFYFGNEKTGGAGQWKYNQSVDGKVCNSVVSTWNAHRCISPTIWATWSVQHPSQTMQKIECTNDCTVHDLQPISGSSRVHSACTASTMDSTATSAAAKEPPAASCSLHQRLPRHSDDPLRAPPNTWFYEYKPPDYYKVPPPKLRYELNDYHSTFYITQPGPTTALYLSEQERFYPTLEHPVTAATSTVKKSMRRQFPSK